MLSHVIAFCANLFLLMWPKTITFVIKGNFMHVSSKSTIFGGKPASSLVFLSF